MYRLQKAITNNLEYINCMILNVYDNQYVFLVIVENYKISWRWKGVTSLVSHTSLTSSGNGHQLFTLTVLCPFRKSYLYVKQVQIWAIIYDACQSLKLSDVSHSCSVFPVLPCNVSMRASIYTLWFTDTQCSHSPNHVSRTLLLTCLIFTTELIQTSSRAEYKF